MSLRTDCRQFRAESPCEPHKRMGARCERCDEYDAVSERILIVKLGALGDVLRTTSCLAPLKVRYPRSHITWITRPNAGAILSGNPQIDRVLTIDQPYLEYVLSERFDVAIGPETDPLSTAIMRLAKADDKRGFVSDDRGRVRPMGDAALAWLHTSVDDGCKRENRRTYGEWLYGVCDLPTPVAPPSLMVGAATRARVSGSVAARTAGSRTRACINTGASGRWREKRWSAAHYRDFARLLTRETPDVALVLVGGPDEAQLHRELLSSSVGFVDGGVHHSVEEFGALVASCDWMLTPDSLGYHVACAVGTPAVCLVGPTSPWELDRYGRNLVLHSQVPCIACYRAECPLPRTCMDRLTPDATWSFVRTWRAAADSPFRELLRAVPTGEMSAAESRVVPPRRRLPVADDALYPRMSDSCMPRSSPA